MFGPTWTRIARTLAAGVLAVVACGASNALAQELPGPMMGEVVDLPAPAAEGLDLPHQMGPHQMGPLQMGPDEMGPGEGPSAESTEPAPAASMLSIGPMSGSPLEDLSTETHYPLLTESSGTWIRRGLWYSDVDAVIMNRSWDGHALLLVEEFGNLANPFGTRIQQRDLNESSRVSDTSARLSLGRFLFRDAENRDHTAEFVVFGGAQWVERGEIVQAGTVGLSIPALLDGNGQFTSFDGANASQYGYRSRFNDFEWNYNVTERMRRDRMELQPSGEWVRRASNGWTKEYSAGLRLLNIGEDVTWAAQRITSVNGTAPPNGLFQTQASNNLFGPQVGVGVTYETDRWNATVGVKQGFLVNDARARRNLRYFTTDSNVTLDPTQNFSTDAHANTIAYLASVQVLARYHLRPNLSLRAGWELLFVTSTVAAPSLLTFDPAYIEAPATSGQLYNGYVFGAEYYW